MAQTQTKILIFAKAPIPGQVKTRLTPAITPTQAAKLHEQLFHHTLNTVQQTQLAPIEIWTALEHTHPMFQTYQQQNIPIHQQQGKTLGERLNHATQQTLKNSKKVIVIGSDCAILTKHYIQQAIIKLTTKNDCIIGPAEDGGYVLIGLQKHHPEIFNNINWGTNTVLKQTQQQLNKIKWSHQLLPTLWDIDRIEDVKRLEKIKATTSWANK